MPSLVSMAASLLAVTVTAIAVSETWSTDEREHACPHECSESVTTGAPWLEQAVREGEPTTFRCTVHPCAKVDLVSPPGGASRLEATVTSEAGGSYTVRVDGVGNHSMWTESERFGHGRSVAVFEAPFAGTEWMMEFTPRWSDGYGGDVTLGIRWLED